MNRLIITRYKGQVLSSLFFDWELISVNLGEKKENDILGNIYLGKVKNIVKNINAAFVEIENGQMCFLSLDENKTPIFSNKKNNNLIQMGDEIYVQVNRENVKTKAPMVTCHLNLTGKYLVLTHGKIKTGISSKILEEKERLRLRKMIKPYENETYGFIIRTNATAVKEEQILEEADRLIGLYEHLKETGVHKVRFSLLYKEMAPYLCDIRDGYIKEVDEIVTDEKDLYQEMKEYLERNEKNTLGKLRFYEDPMLSLEKLYGIENKIGKALHKKVWLKCGGYLVIEPTEALTVIDVNTGKAVSGKKKAQETFYKVNQEAALEIAKQLRLRNLSGIILVDFIDMESEESKECIMELLRESFRKDSIKTDLVDMTVLNLVEITRKKVRKPLTEQMDGWFTQNEFYE